MNNTIPASAFVSVNPAVLGAGGAALNLNGLFIDDSGRVPHGSVLSFASAANVGSYFGLSSLQYGKAQVYFAGFNNANIRPGQLLYSQFNLTAGAAFERGGSLATMSLSAMQALTGSVTATVDGYARDVSSITLAGATSPSNAAALIQTAMNAAITTVASCATASIVGLVLSTTGTVTGTFGPGLALTGTGITTGTYITGPGPVTGQYALNVSSTVSSIAVAGAPSSITVSYDSIAAAMVIQSGITGAISTITFASGTLATALSLTSATGAVLSQGAAADAPNAFMSALVGVTTSWATFTTLFDPDGGSGNTQKQAFAAWNTLQNNRYMYVPWDTDITPTESTNAATSLGQILIGNGNSGTAPIYEPSDLSQAAFICGMVASIDFTEHNGNTSAGFKSQAGITPGVTNQTVMTNLIANGYNAYVSVANANNQWQYLYPGTVTGLFKTIQRYVNQIWLNSSLQTALMTLLTTVKAVPYAQPGYTLIEAACQDPINAAINFGMVQKGVTLSAAQIAEINYQAGLSIASTIQNQGWYLQVLDPGAVVRGNSGSPAITFWYTDGGSVLSINLASIDVI